MRLRIADCGLRIITTVISATKYGLLCFEQASIMRIRNPSALIRNSILLATTFMFGCANGANPAEPAAENPPAHKADQGEKAEQAKMTTAFDGERAFNHVKAQVELGPRPAGSPAIEKTR